MNYTLRIIGIVLVALPIFGIAQTTADLIKIHDTRDISETPEDFKKVVRFDFKRRTAVGVPGTGSYSGQLTIAPWSDNSGGKHHQLNFNSGGVFYRTALPDDTLWGAWQKLIIENREGNVGIGTATPSEKLSVNGNIRAREVKVETANWPDYIFEEDYDLMPLSELETYINTYGHLPGVPSAKEAEADGIGLAEMNRTLLEKVEELTLHLIEREKSERTLREELQATKQDVHELKNLIKEIKVTQP